MRKINGAAGTGCRHLQREPEHGTGVLSTAPETLVGMGFRGWIRGAEDGDLSCLQHVWTMYSNALGPLRARVAVDGLAKWSSAVSFACRCKVEVGRLEARGFCRNESLAVSMIAACQHNTCPAMRACAFALIENGGVDEVLHHASTFALILRSLDKVVPASWIVNANAYVAVPSGQLH